jgi:hypothetical protein
MTTRVGIGTGHLALGATHAPQTTAASSGAPMPSTHTVAPSPTVNPPVGQRGQHGQLAQEPDGQGDAAQPAHAVAARSASALRCARTLRIPLSRVRRL